MLRGYFGRAGTLVFRGIETALARATDRLVAVSPEVRDELVALGVAPMEKFTVVRLGLELERRVAFSGDASEVRRRHGIASEAFVVGWFGRMTPAKQTDDLLTALARYSRLVFDSWTRPTYCKLAGARSALKDATIERRFKRYGDWAGLAFWLYLTRSWVEEGLPV